MSYFQEIEGDVAILTSGGVFKQAPLYVMDGNLFAKASGGFVRINATGGTSKPKLSVVKLVTDLKLFKDTHGRLTTQSGPKTKPLADEQVQKLIAPPSAA